MIIEEQNIDVEELTIHHLTAGEGLPLVLKQREAIEQALMEVMICRPSSYPAAYLVIP